MGTHSEQGFTIIETMLVLAITGVMVASLLVGIGGTINAQRYKDSVSTFQSTLQDQYNQVNNVTNVNDRNSKWSCGSNATTADLGVGAPTGTVPGQSDCVLLGRYVTVIDDKITTAAVVGNENATTAQANDIATITKNYALGLSSSSVETSTLEWGAAIAWPTSGLDAPAAATTGRAIAVLILRAPTSGSVYTFTTNTVPTDISAVSSAQLIAMMQTTNAVPGQAQRFICIDPSPGSTGLTVPEKLSITIDQAATDTNGIETRSDSVNTTMNQVSKCN